MTVQWDPIFVLPNVPLQIAIECDIAALALAHDPRIAALKRVHPAFRRFLGRFSGNFGTKFEPCSCIPQRRRHSAKSRPWRIQPRFGAYRMAQHREIDVPLRSPTRALDLEPRICP